MEKKAVIFDLDGVIVFTDRFHYMAWKKVADDLEIVFDEQINNRLRGVSRMESLEIILEKYNGAALSMKQKCELAEKKNAIYREFLKTMQPADVEDKVRETLRILRERGYKLAIGSSSKNAKMILEKVGLLSAFDAISDGTNIMNSKPNPEVFIKAADFLGVLPEECYVVEDADAGIEAAKGAKMHAIGIGEAGRYKKTDICISEFAELVEIVR